MSQTAEQMLRDFTDRQGIYRGFAESIKHLLTVLIKAKKIDPHTISARIKTIDSLSAKIRRPEKEYSELNDVTDLVGLRVITYFTDDVDRISSLVRDEFVVDEDNSIDKRMADESFGYSSLHIVCSLTQSRLSLVEYGDYRNLRCEIQIRTILQHAWAEIEHDLGYKAPEKLPSRIRRRFSKLAALLELADDEFLRLRGETEDYEQAVEKRLRGMDIDDESTRLIELNEVTFWFVVDNVPAFVRGEARVFAVPNIVLSLGRPSASRLVEWLHDLGVKTIGQFFSVYTEFEEQIVAMARGLRLMTQRSPERHPKSGRFSDSVHQLAAHDWHFFWRLDAEACRIASNFEHGDFEAAIDDDGFSHFPRQNKHCGILRD